MLQFVCRREHDKALYRHTTVERCIAARCGRNEHLPVRGVDKAVEHRVLSHGDEGVVIGDDVQPVIAVAGARLRRDQPETGVWVDLQCRFFKVVGVAFVQIPEDHAAAREHDLRAFVVILRLFIALLAQLHAIQEADVDIALRRVDDDPVKCGPVHPVAETHALFDGECVVAVALDARHAACARVFGEIVKIVVDNARVRAVTDARLAAHIVHAGARAGVVAVLRRGPSADLDELVIPDGVIIKSRFLTRRKPVAPEFGKQRSERVIDRRATALFELIYDPICIDIEASCAVHIVFPHLSGRRHTVDVIELDRYIRPLIITFLAAIHINSAIAHKQCAEMAYIRAILYC